MYYKYLWLFLQSTVTLDSKWCRFKSRLNLSEPQSPLCKMRIELFTLKNFKYKLRQRRGGTQNYAWYIMSVQYIKVVIIKPQMSTCSFSCGLLCLPCLFSICSLKWWTCLETQALLLPNNPTTHSTGLDLFYQNSEAFCMYMSHLLSCVG